MSTPETRPPNTRVELVVPVRTMVSLLAFATLVVLVVFSLGTLLSIFIAAVLALGLDPIVARLVARGWGRGRASLAVFAALFVAVVALILVAVGPVWDQVEEFLRALPAYWDELTQKDWFQTLVSTGNADDKVRELLKDLAAGLPDAADALLGIIGGVVGSVLSMVTLTFLALFLLMERPSITKWLFGFTPPATEARWSPVVEDSIRGVSTSLLGNIAISIVAGTVAFISAWAFGLPFPLVLAVITGLLDLIPQIGATIAAIILTLVALTVSTEAAIAMVIIQLIYQQVENYIVYPIVYRQAVELTGFTTIAAVLIAGSLLGVVGAILAVPFATIVKIVIHEAGRPRRDQMEQMRGASAEGGAPPESPVSAPDAPVAPRSAPSAG